MESGNAPSKREVHQRCLKNSFFSVIIETALLMEVGVPILMKGRELLCDKFRRSCPVVPESHQPGHALPLDLSTMTMAGPPVLADKGLLLWGIPFRFQGR
jgi:hypothetical protein